MSLNNVVCWFSLFFLLLLFLFLVSFLLLPAVDEVTGPEEVDAREDDPNIHGLQAGSPDLASRHSGKSTGGQWHVLGMAAPTQAMKPRLAKTTSSFGQHL